MIINLNINDFAQISSKVLKFEALKFLNFLWRLAAGFKGLTPFKFKARLQKYYAECFQTCYAFYISKRL